MQGNYTMGSRRLTNGALRFYARWRDETGTSCSQPLDVTSRKEGRAAIATMNAGRTDGRVRISPADALESFLGNVARNRTAATLSYYEGKLRPLWLAWQQTPLPRWNRRMLEEYIAAHPSWSPRTVQMLVNTCKRFIAWATDTGLDVPDFVGRFRGPTVHKTAPTTLTPDQVDALLTAATGRKLEPAIALASLAGLRHAEFMRLDAGDIDWQKGRLVVRKTKTHRDRHVPMSPRLQGVLKSHRRISGPVVRAGAIGNGSNRLRDLRALCAKAGVPEVSWHPLRHTFATIIAAKHPLHVVQALLGHSNVATTSIYLHAKDDDLRRAVEALG